jgi:hypothetical protein
MKTDLFRRSFLEPALGSAILRLIAGGGAGGAGGGSSGNTRQADPVLHRLL